MRKVKNIGWVFTEILMILFAIFFNPMINVSPYLKFFGSYRNYWMRHILGWILTVLLLVVAFYIQFYILRKSRVKK